MKPHQIFTDLKHTLMRSEFFGKATAGVRLFSDPAKAVELLQKENPETPSHGYNFIKEN